MASLNLEDMQQIQKELQAKYLEKWGGLSPKIGRDKLLWMMIEAGEAADIIKKILLTIQIGNIHPIKINQMQMSDTNSCKRDSNI